MRNEHKQRLQFKTKDNLDHYSSKNEAFITQWWKEMEIFIDRVYGNITNPLLDQTPLQDLAPSPLAPLLNESSPT